MPYSANQIRGPWDPKPDIAPLGDVEFVPDPRISDIYSEEDIARGLLETSAELAAYEFMPNVDVGAMALESAHIIMADRQNRLDVRMAMPRYSSLAHFITREAFRHNAFRQTGDVRYSIKQSRISA